MTQICTRIMDATADDPWFGPCPTCAHTLITHGGPHNPAITECQICLIGVALEEFQTAGQSWIQVLAGSITRPILEQHNDPGHVAHHRYRNRKQGRGPCDVMLPNGETCGKPPAAHTPRAFDLETGARLTDAQIAKERERDAQHGFLSDGTGDRCEVCGLNQEMHDA